MLSQTEKFLIIERKTVDVIFNGKKAEGIRVSEKWEGFRSTLMFWEDEDKWLLGTL